MHSLQEFGDAVKQLAVAIHQRVESTMTGRVWVRAILDVRYNRQGSSWLSKIRAITPNEEAISITMSNEVDLILITLNSMRRNVFNDEWYGLRLEVRLDQQCTIQINYDPNCADDQSFFQS